MFQATTYSNRRKTLAEKLDRGLLLFLGNEDSPMNYTDNTYRFRQDSQFLYYFGIDMPHLAGIIDVDSGASTLYGTEPDMDHVIWMGALPSLKELAAQSGGAHTRDFGQLGEDLAAAIAQGRPVHFLPPYRADNQIRLSKWLGISLDELNSRASIPLIKAVVSMMAYKSPEEVAEMEKAVNITRSMHIAAMKATRPGFKESDLAGIVEGMAIAAGGQLAYSAILSVNGQILHNHYHGNTLQEGKLVLGDFGAEAPSHYAGDITRTFPVSKTFSARQKDIYEIVLEAEVKSIEALQPGVPYRDIHLGAATIIATGLKNLGLMKGTISDAVEAGAHALFFPHGLGHMIGLDVHDMEGLGENYVGYDEDIQRSTQFGLRSLRLGRRLEAGFVLTVEPGIYFIPQLIDLWESEGKFSDFINYDALKAYRDFGGIRIEDNVLVTASGYQVLGQPIPKKVDEVEELRDV
ncbi:MAG TPA: aminopeptidase P family protein [Saprospiraceae bacterium]|nr:aminopeptidase P family protein [Saprospiraceae bacterium]HMQ85671.1 aminopeptidase P family protein [Saprospiraceae bacterium]